jgi:hypothetical protein
MGFAVRNGTRLADRHKVVIDMADDLEFHIPDQVFREVGRAAATLCIRLRNSETKEVMVFTPQLQHVEAKSTWRGQPTGRMWRGDPA